MDNDYVLGWLDSMVFENLDPDRIDAGKIDVHQSGLIISRAEEERQRQFNYIKQLVFRQSKRGRMQLVIRCYYSNLVKLIEAAEANIQKVSADSSEIRKSLEAILSCLWETSSLIIESYWSYLNADAPLPLSSQVPISSKFESLKDAEFVHQEPVLASMVFEEFDHVFELDTKNAVTLRKADYWLLLHELLTNMRSQQVNSEPFLCWKPY